MGALTLKSFPFELRGWDIEKFESLDPTDGFGTSTRVYISKQQIIQIEPDHSAMTVNPWLSDKSRQFFDGIFGVISGESKDSLLTKEKWQDSIARLLKTLYLFEHCIAKTKSRQFLTIVFENLGLETLSLLKVLEQNFSFLRLRRADNLNTSNDLECHFQLNGTTNSNQLKSSTLCMLVGTNPRYEGYRLNLNLRQRYLKGNFKCLVLGPLNDLTFQSTTIGTNTKVFREIAEGNNFTCQDLKAAQRPLLVFGNEFYKRADSQNLLSLFSTSHYTNTVTTAWNGINILNSTLTETGTQSIKAFKPVQAKDFDESSSFYFINVDSKDVPNLKKITELKLLNYSSTSSKKRPKISQIMLDQNSNRLDNQPFIQKLLNLEAGKSYTPLPVKMFYETEETFLSTEGNIKRTTKLIASRKAKESWQLLRNLQKQLKNRCVSLSNRNNNTISFNSVKRSDFVNFMNFQYLAVEKIDTLSPSLAAQNQPFFNSKKHFSFKQNLVKVSNSKLKYWIDDFFIGGKDMYSKNSLVLSNCSKILRTQSTNFF